MSKITEMEALQQVDTVLNELGDGKARERVLRWAWDKYSSEAMPDAGAGEADSGSYRQGATRKSAKRKAVKRKPSRGKGKKPKNTLSIVKDLNLKPKGKKSFREFADQKKPKSLQEKCTVAVYYLQHQHGGVQAITAAHVFTCFKHMPWRVPSDLPNTLAYIASQKGWLDTADMQNIRTTTHGENRVEHDLPKKEARSA